MLKIIGTSHIAKQSIREVTEMMESWKPDIVAVELDRGRLQGLLHPQKTKMRLSDIGRVGLKGWLFAQLGAWGEKKMGKTVGVSPGQDMLAAVKIARQQKIPIALIDQDISVTLRRFSKELTWKEKGRFAMDILSSIFSKKKQEFDLRTVPSQDVIDGMIKQVRYRYPNVYKVLITERNIFMARQLAKLMHDNPDKKILALIGAGHKQDIKELLTTRSK